jgi:hypothetical protein
MSTRKMTNVLQQAIDCNDGDHAVKIVQDALGIESDDVATIASRKPGRPIAGGAPALSASAR